MGDANKGVLVPPPGCKPGRFAQEVRFRPSPTNIIIFFIAGGQAWWSRMAHNHVSRCSIPGPATNFYHKIFIK